MKFPFSNGCNTAWNFQYKWAFSCKPKEYAMFYIYIDITLICAWFVVTNGIIINKPNPLLCSSQPTNILP